MSLENFTGYKKEFWYCFSMRFLISVIDSTTRSPHTPEEIQAIDAINDQMVANGQRLFACGLDSPTLASVFDNRAGSNQVSEGPFIKSAEFFSGFWIIEVNDEQTAHELAAKASKACNRKVELRPLLG
jgi:hypothetical protein